MQPIQTDEKVEERRISGDGGGEDPTSGAQHSVGLTEGPEAILGLDEVVQGSEE
jgi:hypothetical protein